jgi:hypothetical protein
MTVASLVGGWITASGSPPPDPTDDIAPSSSDSGRGGRTVPVFFQFLGRCEGSDTFDDLARS